jgi:hypothetical protein
MSTTKSILIAFLLLQASPRDSFGQTVAAATKSPKEMIEDFAKIETTGSRLTADGRLKACSFFVRASPFEAHPKIFVIGSNYLVWDPVVPVENGKTQIRVEMDPKGFIDSKLRFTAMGHQLLKNSALYNLVFAAPNERPDPNCKPVSEVADRKRWMIDGPNDVVMVTIDAAKRYVDSQRNKPTDATVRKNASETLSQLANLK